MARSHDNRSNCRRRSSAFVAPRFSSIPLDAFASSYHQPIMVREVLSALLPEHQLPEQQTANPSPPPLESPGRVFLDCTLGGAGHSEALLHFISPHDRLFSIDRDPDAISFATHRLQPFLNQWTPILGNYRDTRALLDNLSIGLLDGILLDAGVSSSQLDSPERGFSFQHQGPLDMRMGPDAVSLNSWLHDHSADEIGRVIADYGELSGSFRIARKLKQDHQEGLLNSTADLAQSVLASIPRTRNSATHPATRVFQALRIAVNDEIQGLQDFVDSIPSLLKPGGRVAVISFHSLEDRIVKRAFSFMANPCLCPPNLPFCACNPLPLLHVLTQRPIQPSPEELDFNPRARSAKLRVAERVDVVTS